MKSDNESSRLPKSLVEAKARLKSIKKSGFIKSTQEAKARRSYR